MTKVADGSEVRVALAAGARVGFAQWSSDGKRYACINTTADAVELWLGEVMSAKVRRVANVRLNPVLDSPFEWLPDQKALLVELVPENQTVPLPRARAAPPGPNIQEALGEKGSSTYEVADVLNSEESAVSGRTDTGS